MKRIIIVILCITPLFSQAQNGYFIEPIVNPITSTLGSSGFDEKGINAFDFTHEMKSSPEFVVNIGKTFKGTNWSAGLGLSVKNQQHDFNYQNYSIDEGLVTVATNKGFIKQSFIGYRLFSSYQFSEKLACRLTLELADPVKVEKSYSTNTEALSQIELIDGMQSTIFDIEKNETITPSGSPYLYVIPELQVSYNIHKSIDLLAGMKFNLLNGDYMIYNLLIEGQIEDYPEPQVLNDSRIYNEFMSVHIGVKYKFEL